jgi:drug/metabolite transporter (DMT)-like permease
MFISGLGLFVTGTVAQIIVRLGYVKLVNADTVTFKFWLMKIVPAGAGTALSHTFGNGAMMYLTVAFVQMLKSFTPAIVMIMLAIFKIDIPSKEIVLSVVVLCGGTAFASFGEMNMK